MRFDMHCKAFGGKIMIPGRLAWEKAKTSGHKSRFGFVVRVQAMGGDDFQTLVCRQTVK